MTRLLTRLLASSLVIVVAACSGGTQSSSQGAPKQEIVVDFGSNGLGNLDPLKWRSTAEKNAFRLVYDALTTYDVSMKLQPQLAASWTNSADKLSWTFKLRSGVKFADGSPVDAAAVKFNFDRMIDPTSVSLNGPTFGGVIASVTATDPLTVTVATKGQQSSLPGMLAGWGGEIANPAAVNKLATDPSSAANLGSGPYKVDSFQANSQTAFKRNDAYWGTRATLDAITVKTIPEVSARVAALSSGQTQVALGMQANQLSLLQQNAALNVTFADVIYMEYIGINTRQAPLNDKLVRQAIAYAINMTEINNTVYAGHLKLSPGPVPAALPAFDSSITGYSYDPAKAKALLSQAGKTTLNLELLYYDRPDYERFVQLVQAQLAAVGITITVKKLEYAAFYDKLTKGESQIFIQGWGNSTGQAVYTLRSLYGSKSPGAVNLTGFGDAKVDGNFQDALSSFDEGAARQSISAAQKAIIDSAASPYVWSPQNANVTVKGFSNWTPTPVADFTSFTTAILK